MDGAKLGLISLTRAKPGRIIPSAVIAIAAGLLFWPVLLCAQGATPAATTLPSVAMPSFGKIFTYFLVMLGPMKLLGPFARLTTSFDQAQARRLALRASIIATLGGFVAVIFGRSLLDKWSISLPALLIAAGLVLLLVALRDVMSQFSPNEKPGAPERIPPGPIDNLAFSPIAFPHIITPYGAAALILLTTIAPTISELLTVLATFVLVMILNLVVMWFAPQILKHGAAALGLLGAVLGVMQVALAVQVLINAWRMLHMLS